MKTYLCLRCGKKMIGRTDRCPRCGQRHLYCQGGKYFDALGNEYILTKDETHIKKVIPNPDAPSSGKRKSR